MVYRAPGFWTIADTPTQRRLRVPREHLWGRFVSYVGPPPTPRSPPGLEAAQHGIPPHREMLRYATASQPLDARRRSCTAPTPGTAQRLPPSAQTAAALISSNRGRRAPPRPRGRAGRPMACRLPRAYPAARCHMLPPAHRARRPRSAPQPPPAGARALGGEWLAPPALTPPGGPSRMPMRIPGSTDTRDWLRAGRKKCEPSFFPFCGFEAVHSGHAPLQWRKPSRFHDGPVLLCFTVVCTEEWLTQVAHGHMVVYVVLTAYSFYKDICVVFFRCSMGIFDLCSSQ